MQALEFTEFQEHHHAARHSEFLLADFDFAGFLDRLMEFCREAHGIRKAALGRRRFQYQCRLSGRSVTGLQYPRASSGRVGYGAVP